MNSEAKRHIMSSDLGVFLSYRMFCHSDSEHGKLLEDIRSFLRKTWNGTSRQMETDNDLDITVQQDRDCIIGL